MSDDSKYEPDSALPLLRILARINYGVRLITTIAETLGVCVCVRARASVRVLNYCNWGDWVMARGGIPFGFQYRGPRRKRGCRAFGNGDGVEALCGRIRLRALLVFRRGERSRRAERGGAQREMKWE